MLSFVVSLMREKRSSQSWGHKSEAQPPDSRMLLPGLPRVQEFLPFHLKKQPMSAGMAPGELEHTPMLTWRISIPRAPPCPAGPACNSSWQAAQHWDHCCSRNWPYVARPVLECLDDPP